MNYIYRLAGFLLLTLSLTIFSCSDDSLQIGLDLLPDTDKLNAGADTLAVSLYTYKGIAGEVLRSSSNNDNCPVGKVFDPVFGATKADVVMELLYAADVANRYPKNSKTDPSDSIVSIKLYLATTNLQPYGEKNSLDIDVIPINQRYVYSGKTNQQVPSDYFDVTNNAALQTTNLVTKDSIPRQISTLDTNESYTVIELDANQLSFLLDSAINKSTTAFYTSLPGILLRGNAKEGTNGALQNFLANKSKLILEYQRTETRYIKDEDGDTISISDYDTLYYSTCDIANYRASYVYTPNGRNAEIEDVFRDTLNQYSNLYLQSMGATRGMFRIEGLDDFKTAHDKGVGINFAELVLPINADYLSDTNFFALPKRIIAHSIVEGSIAYLPDDIIGSSYFNGYLDEEKMEYRINLTEYISQFMLDKSENTLLSLMVGQNSSVSPSLIEYKYPSRVVINSGLETNTSKAYLRIIYTLTNN